MLVIFQKYFILIHIFISVGLPPLLETFYFLFRYLILNIIVQFVLSFLVKIPLQFFDEFIFIILIHQVMFLTAFAA
jgi:hypothetical protein